MAVPQDWMPPDMPEAQKDEIAARHPNDPEAAAAEAWIVWANDMPVDQAITVTTGAQSVTYDQTAYDASMERARWYLSRSKDATAVHVGGDYVYGYVSAPEADVEDMPLANGEPWGAHTLSTDDVILTNPVSRLRNDGSTVTTQEHANRALVAMVGELAHGSHVHDPDGAVLDLTDYVLTTDANIEYALIRSESAAGLTKKSERAHTHDDITDQIAFYETKADANENYSSLQSQIAGAATSTHGHDGYCTSAQVEAGYTTLDGRITQVSSDKADEGHEHIAYQQKLAAEESRQDLQDQIDLMKSQITELRNRCPGMEQ